MTLPSPGPVPPRPGSLADVEHRLAPVASFEDRVLAALIDALVSLVASLPMFLGFVLLVVGAVDVSVGADGTPDWDDGGRAVFVVGIVVAVLGWLLTALAGSLGAPFWFDLLGKAANLRSAGRKPAAGATPTP